MLASTASELHAGVRSQRQATASTAAGRWLSTYLSRLPRRESLSPARGALADTPRARLARKGVAMKLLRAFVTANSVIPVLRALRAAGGRPVVPPQVDSGDSEYELLLEDLVLGARGDGLVVRIRAICQDDDADRSVTAVAEAAQASRETAVVLITPWNKARAPEPSARSGS